jgi:hypothetical protein
MKPASIGGGDFPAHNLGMSANEKVRKWHVMKRHVGLGLALLPIPTVCRGTDVGCRYGHIENLDAPTAYPVGHSRRV